MILREDSSTRWWKAVSVVVLAGVLVVAWNTWRGEPRSESEESTRMGPQSTRTARAQQTANRNLAELHLSDVRVDTTAASGDVIVTFVYENTGSDTEGPFALYAYDLDVVPETTGFTSSRKRSVVIPSLGREQTGELTVTYRSVDEGTYQACAVIDVWNEVAEQEEGLESNRRCGEVRVGSGQRPTTLAAYVPAESLIPRSVRPSERFQATIVFNNTSTVPWTSATHIVRNLDYSSRATVSVPRFLWGISSVELKRGARIEPGASARFEFAARAPTSAGLYRFRWQLTQERADDTQEPFGDLVDVPIVVSDEEVALPPPSPSPLESVDTPLREDSVFPNIPSMLPFASEDLFLIENQQESLLRTPQASSDALMFRYSITPMPRTLGTIMRGKHVDATAIIKLEEGTSQSIRLTAVDNKGDSRVRLYRDLLPQLTIQGELITARIEISNATSAGEHTVTVTGEPGGVTATWQFTVEGAAADTAPPPSLPSLMPQEESALPPLAPPPPPQPEESPTPPPPSSLELLPLPPLGPQLRSPAPRSQAPSEPLPRPPEAPRTSPEKHPPQVLIKPDPAASTARLLYAGLEGSSQPLVLMRYTLEPRGEAVELRTITVRATRNINVVRSVVLAVNDQRFGPLNGVRLNEDGEATVRQRPPVVLYPGTTSTVSISVFLNRASEILSGRSFEIGVLAEDKEGKATAAMDMVGVKSALAPHWINDRGDQRGTVALSPTFTIFDGIPMLKRDNGFLPSSKPQALHTIVRFHIAALGTNITIVNVEITLSGSCHKGGEGGAKLIDTTTGKEYLEWPKGTDWVGASALSALGGRQNAREWRMPLAISSGAFKTLDLQVDTSGCAKDETLNARLGGRTITRSGLVWKDSEQGRLIDVSLAPVLPIVGPTITFR